jgi:hypothetical protein
MRDVRVIPGALASLLFISFSAAATGTWLFAAGDTSATVEELRRLLPSEIEGHAVSGEDKVYTRDTVAEYAGDAADTLLGFPFRLLLVREYLGKKSGASLAVELYDMSASGDAFGIFSHGPPGEPLDIGQEALLGGNILRFWKGHIFVRLRGGGDDPESRALLTSLGRRIAAAIIRIGARPRIVSVLPSEGLDRTSVRYFHSQISLDPHYYLADRNALFLGETTDVALGKYPAAGKETLLLLIRYASSEDAEKAFRRFGGDFFAINVGASTRRIVEEIGPGEAAAALQSGEILVFVLEAPDKTAADALLRRAGVRIAEVFGR